MRKYLISLAVAACLAVGFATPAVAAESVPTLPPTCAGMVRAPQCATYVGATYRTVLASLGVQRPLVPNTTLGQIAQDICLYNDVRPAHEGILSFPDSRIVDFFVAAHRVC